MKWVESHFGELINLDYLYRINWKYIEKDRSVWVIYGLLFSEDPEASKEIWIKSGKTAEKDPLIGYENFIKENRLLE
jgi:hypothetical protein